MFEQMREGTRHTPVEQMREGCMHGCHHGEPLPLGGGPSGVSGAGQGCDISSGGMHLCSNNGMRTKKNPVE